jgi:hypothetical protein
MKHSIEKTTSIYEHEDGQHNLNPNHIFYLGQQPLNDTGISKNPIQGKR